MIKPPNPYTILEIGCGAAPFPGVGERRLLPGDHYIGVDVRFGESDNIAGVRANVVDATDAMGATAEIRRLDATSLPFGDQAIDETVAVNVFGDPRVPRDVRERLAREMARVTLGAITIVEAKSPSEMPLDAMVALMRSCGFLHFNRNSVHDAQLIAQYVYPHQAIRRGEVGDWYAALFGRATSS